MPAVIMRFAMSRERFIPGIYNYCDYWCERCAFTRHCRNFVMGRELEREARGEAPPEDATQEAFWSRLADQLRETTVFGKAGDWANDGADLDFDGGPDPEFEEHERTVERAMDANPVNKLAHDYMMKVHAWLESSDDDLKALAKELHEAAGSPFDDTDYEEQARQIGEMIEVIAWYHTLLPPKVGRALRDLIERTCAADKDDNCSQIRAEARMDDAEASGKLVLVSIDRSAAAWVKMRELLPHREDEILEMLAILSRLRRGINEALPGARNYVRPGLDE
jgi:hypothetical protein